MADEEDDDDDSERGTETRSIANTDIAHDNSNNNDSDQLMRNIFLLTLFEWTPDLLKYMKGTDVFRSGSSCFSFSFSWIWPMPSLI